MSLPYALMPVPRQQFIDGNGDPYANGMLAFFEAGTSTPAEVYADAQGVTSLGTTVDLDASGYAPAIFLAPGGYKVTLTDENDVVIWTVDGVEDVATTFLSSLGEQLLEGTETVTSGYQILETDAFVSVNSTGGPNPCVIYLPFAAGHGQPLCIKNLGTIPIALTLQAGDTLEGLDTVYTIPVIGVYLRPSVWLMADGSSAWWIISSHGVV